MRTPANGANSDRTPSTWHSRKVGCTTAGRNPKATAQTSLHERVAVRSSGPGRGRASPVHDASGTQPGCAGYPDRVGAPTDPVRLHVETTPAQLIGVDAGQDRPNMARDRPPQGWCMSSAPAPGTGHLPGRGRSPGSSGRRRAGRRDSGRRRPGSAERPENSRGFELFASIGIVVQLQRLPTTTPAARGNSARPRRRTVNHRVRPRACFRVRSRRGLRSREGKMNHSMALLPARKRHPTRAANTARVAPRVNRAVVEVARDVMTRDPDRVAGAGRPHGPGPGLASVICRTRGPLCWLVHPGFYDIMVSALAAASHI